LYCIQFVVVVVVVVVDLSMADVLDFAAVWVFFALFCLVLLMVFEQILRL